MSKIRVNVDYPIYDGQSLTFNAPCDCTSVDGLRVYYPGGNKTFSLCDAHNKDISGIGNVFSSGALIKVVLDVANERAYLQNADYNTYIDGLIRKYGQVKYGTYEGTGDVVASLDLGFEPGVLIVGNNLDYNYMADTSKKHPANHFLWISGQSSIFVNTVHESSRLNNRDVDTHTRLVFTPNGNTVSWMGYYHAVGSSTETETAYFNNAGETYYYLAIGKNDTIGSDIDPGGGGGEVVVPAVLYTPQLLTEAQKAQARKNIGAQEEVSTTEIEKLKTVAIKYNYSYNRWVNYTTFEYTTEGENNQYGPVVAEQSTLSGGLLKVNWDTNVATHFNLNLYLFDSNGNPYKYAGLSENTPAEFWAGDLYEPTYIEAGTPDSTGVAVAPFSVQIPPNCTCMCWVRWVPGNASSPNGSIADWTDFQNWVLSGGVTFTVEKTYSGYVEKNFGATNANRYLVTDKDGIVVVGGIADKNSNVPKYIKTKVNEIATTLKAVQDAHPKSATFAFITDHHFHYNSEHLVRHNLYAIEEISKKCRVEFAAYGGDNLADSENPHDYALDMLKYFGNILRDYDVRTLITMGNHDDNTLSGYTAVGSYPVNYALTPKEFYSQLYRDNENVFNISMDANRDKLYFYVDLPSQQIRVIFLNVIDIPYKDDGTGELIYKGCRDSGYSNEQLNWVVSDALNFSDKKHPEQWGVITIQHFTDCPYIPDFCDYPVTQNRGGEAMYNIFRAFKNREAYTSTIAEGDFAHDVSCDFTDAKAKLICRIAGHTHADRVAFDDGILYLSTMAAGKNGVGTGVADDGNVYNKTEDSAEESAFDFFTFDKDTQTIYATRFGAGVDRVIKWNVLPISWLIGYHIGHAVGSVCAVTEHSSYLTCEKIPVEYGKTYQISFVGTAPNGTEARWVGLDDNDIVTESVFAAEWNIGDVTLEWTPTSTATKFLRFRGFVAGGMESVKELSVL